MVRNAVWKLMQYWLFISKIRIPKSKLYFCFLFHKLHIVQFFVVAVLR